MTPTRSGSARAVRSGAGLGIPPGVLLAPAGLCLLAGLDAALLLAGLPAPLDRGDLPGRHGMLMVLGFLGTLIALERAVALRRGWAFAAPALLGVGGLLLAIGAPQVWGSVALVDGCLALLAVYASLYARQRDSGTAVEALGAVAALGAALAWLRLEVYPLLPLLACFIVLTIAAERVELARLHRPAGDGDRLLGLALAVTAAAAASLLWPVAGTRAFGAALVVVTAWSAYGDVARHTVRATGLPRFSAVALLTGYAWLLVAGLAWLVAGPPGGALSYDVVVHATFLGFAMSMVLAHAPVILPAVLHRPLPYRRLLWAPLALLHGALVVRLALGGGLDRPDVWRVGAALTVLALLLFPAATAFTAIAAARSTAPSNRQRTSANRHRTRESAPS